MTMRRLGMMLPFVLAGCATQTDWSLLATPPTVHEDRPEPGVTAAFRPGLAMLASPGDGFSLCERAVQAAEARERTPAGLLDAIARVESGRSDPRSHAIRPWPWSIDVDGQSRFFTDQAQAIAGVRTALAAGATSVDVGCMQVNLQYHPNAFRSLQEAFDPMANAAYAAHFLKTLWAEAPDAQWRTATGYYHSHTPDLAETYRRQVQAAAGAPCRRGPAASTAGGLVQRLPDPLVVAAGTVLAPSGVRPAGDCPRSDSGIAGKNGLLF